MKEVTFIDQAAKLLNFLKIHKKRYYFCESTDSYSISDLKRLGEYGCMCLLVFLTGENITEKIKFTAQMKATAIKHKKLTEFKAFLTKISRKKTQFSEKQRQLRRRKREKNPLTEISPFQQIIIKDHD